MGRLSEKDQRNIKRLGFNLRKIRQAKGWTLEKAEEMAILGNWPGCSWKHLQKIETGKKDVNVSTLYKLASLYKVDIFKLFPKRR